MLGMDRRATDVEELEVLNDRGNQLHPCWSTSTPDSYSGPLTLVPLIIDSDKMHLWHSLVSIMIISSSCLIGRIKEMIYLVRLSHCPLRAFSLLLKESHMGGGWFTDWQAQENTEIARYYLDIACQLFTFHL